MAATLYERLGGANQVSRIVISFYDKIVVNPKIGHFFVNTDMQRLVDHQVKYVSSVMGGPSDLSDSELARFHAKLEISDVDFDIMMGLFRDALVESGISDDDVNKVSDRMFAKRPLVVL